MARIAIQTPILDVINTLLWVKVDAEVFLIRVVEEPSMIEEWGITNREDNDGFCVSPTSLSTSISVVPDSFGNLSARAQQPAVVTSLKVVANFSNFKPEQNELANPTPIDCRPIDGMKPVTGRKAAPFQDASCRTNGTTRLSTFFEVGVSKSQGWGGSPEKNWPLSSLGQRVQMVAPMAECSGGPGIRPELLKRTDDIRREVDSVNSPPPGPIQQKTDRGKGKRTKK
ncbi:hypothetical protein Ancab_021166, partial [Ancistrocladus abbreviatus]